MKMFTLKHPVSGDVISSRDFYVVERLMRNGYEVIPDNRGNLANVASRQKAKYAENEKSAREMWDYYQAGHTLRQTAKQWGITHQRVHQIFKSYGLES